MLLFLFLVSCFFVSLFLCVLVSRFLVCFLIFVPCCLCFFFCFLILVLVRVLCLVAVVFASGEFVLKLLRCSLFIVSFSVS